MISNTFMFKMYYIRILHLVFICPHFFSFRYNFREIRCSKTRLLCIFSLMLYCFDTGSDVFVSIDLFIRCHWRYATSVLTTILLPGLCHGLKKHFIHDGSVCERDFLYYLFIYPIKFIPITFWKLVQAVIASQEGYEGKRQTSSLEENRAKK